MNYTESREQAIKGYNEPKSIQNINWKSIKSKLDYRLKTGDFGKFPQGRDIFDFLKKEITNDTANK